MRFVLFASEVGTLLGKNRFQTVEDAIQKVLLRTKPTAVNPAYVEKEREIKELITKSIDHLTSINEVKSCVHEMLQTTPVVQHPVINQVAERVTSAINCTAGVRGEEECIRQRAIPSTQMGFGRTLTKNLRLYGKVDGITETHVIEIKTRQKRLWKRLWPQELVQVYVYMFLTERDRCTFIEQCRGESFEDEIVWDENTWLDIVSELADLETELNIRIGKY